MGMTAKLLEHNGEAHTVREWARLYGLTYGTLSNRLYKGIPLAKALAMPTKKTPKNIKLCDPLKCGRCFYSEQMSGSPACFYIDKNPERHRRPCPAGACTVYKPRGRATRNEGRHL